MCFIYPYYSKTKNKGVKKERRQAYPFSSRMICSVVHEAKRGREKKKKTVRNGIESQPLSTIYPPQLALNSWSELWVTLPATCPAQEPVERPFLFLALAKWQP